MSSLNDIVQRVKVKLQPFGVADDDFAFMVGQEMFPALEELARDVAVDPETRNHFLTDPALATAVLDASGEADLSALITSDRILLDCLRYGEIYPPVNDEYPTQPFRLITNGGQRLLASMFGGLVLRASVEGTTLKTISPTNNVEPLVGTITFQVPYIPTLAQVPFPLEGKLVDILVRRLRGRQEVEAAQSTENQ